MSTAAWYDAAIEQLLMEGRNTVVESCQRVTVCPIHARGGMVTAMHPEAARAGANVLKCGGNAVDAFVAAALAVGVGEPFMSGLGGHGSVVVRNPDGVVRSVDFVTKAPQAAVRRASEIEHTGPTAIPIPTCAAGFAELHRAFGKLQLDRVAEGAVELAASGIPVEGYTAGMVARYADVLRRDQGAHATFLSSRGLPPRPPTSAFMPGDVLAMPTYADTLRTWAALGDSSLRTGPIAAALVAWMERNGGFVTSADLHEAPVPQLGSPAKIDFDGFEIHGAPGASGFPFLAEVLGIWADYSPDDVPIGSVTYYHLLIESFRATFEDRFRWLGDPAGGRSPFEVFFEARLSRRRAAAIFRSARADAIQPLDLTRSDLPVLRRDPPDDPRADDGCTTHVNAIDNTGMAVSGTFTLGEPFGAAVVVPETGMLLLNNLFQYNREPGHPNELRTDTHPVWNSSPLLITRDGSLVALVGAPGARRILTALTQVLLAQLRYGRADQAAVDVPRVHVETGLVDVDDRVSPDVIDGLRRLGHDLRLVHEGPSSANFARPTSITVNQDGSLASGLDAGRLATAVGVD